MTHRQDRGTCSPAVPTLSFGSMSVILRSMSSNYNSLQAKLRKEILGGFWYLVSYTFSKSLVRQAAPELGGNATYEYGLAMFDVPHVLAVSSGYALPFGQGKAVLGGAWGITDALIGGWHWPRHIVNFRSGVPFTPTISTDTANIGVRQPAT